MAVSQKRRINSIDQLKEAGQSYWQILPLGPTGYGDSPYQSFSTYAGNPYFIDLKTLIKEGLLTKKECKVYDFGEQADSIDYEKIYNSRFKVLKKAFERFEKMKHMITLSKKMRIGWMIIVFTWQSRTAKVESAGMNGKKP